MLTHLRVLILLCVMAGSSGSAMAAMNGMAEGEVAFAAGHFLDAITIGEKLQNADGDSLMARAGLVEAAYLAPPDQRLQYLEDSELWARRALNRDPDHVEAMLNLVIALGYRARLMGKMAAHRAGLAREAKDLINRALELQPDDPWAWAVLGGWHGEIVATGGFLGALAYKAKSETVRTSFEKAMLLDPENPALAVEYAKILLRMGPRKYAARAHDILTIAADKPPRTAFEAILATQGRDLLLAMDSRDPDAIQATLVHIVPFAK